MPRDCHLPYKPHFSKTTLWYLTFMACTYSNWLIESQDATILHVEQLYDEVLTQAIWIYTFSHCACKLHNLSQWMNGRIMLVPSYQIVKRTAFPLRHYHLFVGLVKGVGFLIAWMSIKANLGIQFTTNWARVSLMGEPNSTLFFFSFKNTQLHIMKPTYHIWES